MHSMIHSFGCFLRLLILITIFLVWTVPSVHAEDPFRAVTLPRAARQGEACLIRVTGPASPHSISMEFEGVRYPMAFSEENGTYEGLLGIDMGTQPGLYDIKIVSTDGGRGGYRGVFSFRVEKVDFGIQKLSLPSSMVDLDAKTLERVNQETKRLAALFQAFRDERLWKGAFIRPVEGKVSGAFGLNRIINGQERSPHTGVDLEAGEGTPVLASNRGRVVLVDDLFFSGRSVVLDHGWGLYSMYFHLSETLVKEGDRIGKGTMLGRVGSTGRSTKPHLHWGIRMNGARIDPFSLLGATETADSGFGLKQQ
ncbi:MAG: M23 family peptidase [Deltaproteobacteria bacterium]|nr:M23 family peptidase [Deltaproteobacteria bacterium]